METLNQSNSSSINCFDSVTTTTTIANVGTVIMTQQGEYKSGKLHGTKIEYRRNKDNTVMKKCQYANGKLRGTVVVYDEAGDKISEAQYDQGKLHGTQYPLLQGWCSREIQTGE